MAPAATERQDTGDKTPSLSRPIEEAKRTERKTGCARCPECFKTPRLYLLLVFLGFILTVVLLLLLNDDFRNQLVLPVLDWIAANPVQGFLSLLSIYAIWVMFCLPGSLLTFSAGIIYTKTYGVGVGLLVAGVLGNLGQLAGSLLAFLVGRYLLHAMLKRYFETNHTLKAIDRTIQLKGCKISFLLRFTLVFPYAIVNYGLSTTNIPFRVFLFGFLGCLPWEFVEAYFGYCVGSVADVLSGNYSMSLEQYIANGIGIVISLLLTVYVVRVAYLEIRRTSSETTTPVATPSSGPAPSPAAGNASPPSSSSQDVTPTLGLPEAMDPTFPLPTCPATERACLSIPDPNPAPLVTALNVIAAPLQPQLA